MVTHAKIPRSLTIRGRDIFITAARIHTLLGDLASASLSLSLSLALNLLLLLLGAFYYLPREKKLALGKCISFASIYRWAIDERGRCRAVRGRSARAVPARCVLVFLFGGLSSLSPALSLAVSPIVFVNSSFVPLSRSPFLRLSAKFNAVVAPPLPPARDTFSPRWGRERAHLTIIFSRTPYSLILFDKSSLRARARGRQREGECGREKRIARPGSRKSKRRVFSKLQTLHWLRVHVRERASARVVWFN